MHSDHTPDTSTEPTIERWLPIKGYEGIYEVSSFGRVRSLARVDPRGQPRKERILRPALSNGYPYVQLCKNAKPVMTRIHNLVAAAFVGNKPKGYTVNHIDGDKTNNHDRNLEYCTPGENVRHAEGLGLLGKLSKEQVWEIREAYLANPALPYDVFAGKFDVSPQTIRNVVSARRYSGIDNPDGSKAVAIPVRHKLGGIDVYALHNSGLSMGTIARQYGVTTGAVYQAYRKAAALIEGEAKG